MSEPSPFAKVPPEASPPPPAWGPAGPPMPPPAPPGRRAGNPVGAVVALLGLGIAAAGTFALPLSSYGPGGDYGYVNVRSDVAIIAGREQPGAHALYSGLAEFWWRYGVLLASGLLLVLVGALVAVPATRVLGWVIAGVSLAAAVVQGLSMAQSADYRSAVQAFRGYDSANIYTNAGAGVYVSLAGFAVLLVGGLLAALLPTRR